MVSFEEITNKIRNYKKQYYKKKIGDQVSQSLLGDHLVSRYEFALLSRLKPTVQKRSRLAGTNTYSLRY
jgi:hypothetical protein